MKKYIFILILITTLFINGCSSDRILSNCIENANQNLINNTSEENIKENTKGNTKVNTKVNTKENSADVYLKNKKSDDIIKEEIDWNKYSGKWISTSGYDNLFAYENGGIILKLENCNEKEIKGYMTVVGDRKSYIENNKGYTRDSYTFNFIAKKEGLGFAIDSEVAEGNIILLEDTIILRDFSHQKEDYRCYYKKKDYLFLREEILENDNLIKIQSVIGDKIEFTEEYFNEYEIGWDGCSWYCLGAYESKYLASSTMADDGEIKYIPKHLIDKNLKTAWVEGVDGYGIGEYVDIYITHQIESFVNEIYGICIYNGYTESQKLWEENSRVKKIKLWVDNIPYAILDLEDVPSKQVFNVGIIPISYREDLVLRFEILDVYEGTKYKDTCISEITFIGKGH